MEKYPRINISYDYREVLKNSEIKPIVIAAPASTHYSIAKEALLSDKDVFVEKPLALI